ncbi:hypothetical protein F0L17_20555 [Streptomyces sp. TRM43335]|uniref:Uncharacterized protein n=1 Tax=Streptomyces taklimakanensis TaxID=2569853 RepID=A0A6G2BHA9_9ACTN|nr:hypothetical protein [Streptomyces taklimakanensis]MTE21459.1 hypothetical protein [Streptomyces taklimakanensis]
MTGPTDGQVGADTVVGRLFVEALNAGLARARMVSATGGGRRAGPVGEPRPPADPFATAVLVLFDTALLTALDTGERRDASLLAGLRSRARQIVTTAVAAVRQPGRARTLPRPSAQDGLGSAHETLVRTLLLECAALTVCERQRFPAGTVRPADLVRELGRTLRTARHPSPWTD